MNIIKKKSFKILRWIIIFILIFPSFSYMQMAAPPANISSGINPSSGWITSTYGEPRPPGKPHTGIDIGIRREDLPPDVSVSKEGYIMEIGGDAIRGTYVKIKNRDGTISTYCHLDGTPTTIKRDYQIGEGYYVGPGATICKMDCTGHSSCNHLHYTIQDEYSYFLNPADYLGM